MQRLCHTDPHAAVVKPSYDRLPVLSGQQVWGGQQHPVATLSYRPLDKKSTLLNKISNMQLPWQYGNSDLRLQSLWGKTGVFCLAIVLGFVLELLSQMQAEKIGTSTPAVMLQVAVLRDKYHNAAVVSMLSAIAIATMLQ